MLVERYLGIQFRAQEHKFSKMAKTVATFNIYATETSDAVLKKKKMRRSAIGTESMVVDRHF